MRRISAVLLLVSLFAGTAAGAATREEIAIANYRRVVEGQIRITDLPPQQRADVLEIEKKVRAEAEKRTEQGCYEEEVKKLAQPPSELGRRSAAFKCGIPFEEAEVGLTQ